MPSPGPIDVLIVGGGATGTGLLRDLARRGLRCLLVERGDLGTGTSGRHHGLLHSGGRYVAKDPLAARECIDENRVLRRIAPGCVEATGGYFVSTRNDPDDYADAFPGACAAAGVPCEEVPVAELLRREPALDKGIKRAFRVPDGSLEPWELMWATVADARTHGSDAWTYQRLVGFELEGDRIVAADLRDERTGTVTRIAPNFVVGAAGAWAGQVAALAGVTLGMAPAMGTMLIYNQRMTDSVINRCKLPGNGDIMVPIHTVAILGTTSIRVPDPDHVETTRAEIEELIEEGTKLFPDLPKMRLLRAYAGVRPLYEEGLGQAKGVDGRTITRAHAIIDHGARDGVENFVSIVGGKLTTHRLMAEQTADVVCSKLGVTERCTTADEVLPGQVPGHTYWLGHRLDEHERAGGGDADLICECEFVTRDLLDEFLEARWPCDLDDIRRGVRLGMGPCQGGFCTFRAAGILAERFTEPSGDGQAAADADRALTDFLRERFKGTRPIAWGRQLQEFWLVSAIYSGTLGIESLLTSPVPAEEREAAHAPS
jgi:glycerol-3-phosphate dehydrogenase